MAERAQPSIDPKTPVGRSWGSLSPTERETLPAGTPLELPHTLAPDIVRGAEAWCWVSTGHPLLDEASQILDNYVVGAPSDYPDGWRIRDLIGQPWHALSAWAQHTLPQGTVVESRPPGVRVQKVGVGWMLEGTGITTWVDAEIPRAWVVASFDLHPRLPTLCSRSEEAALSNEAPHHTRQA